MVVVGTRPEIIRLSMVINAIHESFELILVHTGQNYDYELNEVFFQDLKLPKPHYFLNCNGKNACGTVGEIISKTHDVMCDERPDALLILGDTNSCLSAYSAKRLKIPVFHMEAGNRCFDQRVPEEINRKIVDAISDFNLPYSQISRSYLINEGFDPANICVTGSPMAEVLQNFRHQIENSEILDKYNLERKNYIVLSLHREENVEDACCLTQVFSALNQIIDDTNVRVYFSAHPRTRKRLQELQINLHENIIFSRPVGFFDYIKLQMNSLVTFSDSGTIFEESTILGFPAVSVRQTHERPEAFEVSGPVLASPRLNDLINAFKYVTSIPQHHEVPVDYKPTNVSEKVVKIILSYTGYINFYKWHKKER